MTGHKNKFLFSSILFVRFVLSGLPIDEWQFPLIPELASEPDTTGAMALPEPDKSGSDNPVLPRFELKDSSELEGQQFAYVW